MQGADKQSQGADKLLRGTDTPRRGTGETTARQAALAARHGKTAARQAASTARHGQIAARQAALAARHGREDPEASRDVPEASRGVPEASRGVPEARGKCGEAGCGVPEANRGMFIRMSAANHDPVFDALAHIPVGEEDLTPEELAELDRRAADLASGRVAGIPHADVQLGLEELRRKAG